MHSKYFAIYQLVGWVLLYIGIMLTVYNTPRFTVFELLFGLILIGCTAGFSAFIRFGYKRWLIKSGLGKQIFYFTIQSVIGAALSTGILIVVVLLGSYFLILDPIAPNQYGYVINIIFWGNAFNMFIALILWSAFYISVIKIRQEKETRQALAGSQLETLIQQLNPHFLFNMLNNIRALILEDPHKARDALAQLSDMLRYSLHQFEYNKVSLAKELTVVEEYLALCKIQFEHRLQFSFEIEETAKSALIPRMLLQLCIENAIKHGIAQMLTGGMIMLSAKVVEQQLKLTISNPIPSAGKKANSLEQANNGVGLKNIRQRLKLMYPSDSNQQNARLDLIIGETEGLAEVHVTLPYEVEVDATED